MYFSFSFSLLILANKMLFEIDSYLLLLLVHAFNMIFTQGISFDNKISRGDNTFFLRTTNNDNRCTVFLSFAFTHKAYYDEKNSTKKKQRLKGMINFPRLLTCLIFGHGSLRFFFSSNLINNIFV
jgi:hypothetical protein